MIDPKLIELANAASIVVALISAFECAVGRVGTMDWRRHRHAFMAGYLLAGVMCMLAAVSPLDSVHGVTLRLASAFVAVHLLVTWRDWRRGPPREAEQGAEHGLMPLAIDSRQDEPR